MPWGGDHFFTHCNWGCRFCQNFDISHAGDGQPVTHAQLAAMMLQLQDMGCHNINLVLPSHVVPQILAALEIAIANGLNVPIVYNTGGYDAPDTRALLDGIVDIYMPDFKFWDPASGRTYCGVPDYPEIARQSRRHGPSDCGIWISAGAFQSDHNRCRAGGWGGMND